MYSFVIQKIIGENCVGIIFQGNRVSVAQDNLVGIAVIIISGWGVDLAVPNHE